MNTTGTESTSLEFSPFRSEPPMAAGDPAPGVVKDWLARIAKRDEAAMASLYRAFSRRIQAYVLNHCHDAALAEEVTVDTMFEVWRRPDRFRGESRFSTWLIGIARHKMIDAIRQREEPTEDLDDFAEILADPAPDAFDAASDMQRRVRVVACLGRLPREQREAMHLVFYQGMTLGEVANVQGIPENTVKTRMFHARRRIESDLRTLRRDEGEPAPGWK